MILIDKCDSYHTHKQTTYLDPKTVAYLTGKWPENNGAIESEVGVCWGTKEREECNCEGDRSKCTFYPDKREEDIKNTSNTELNAIQIEEAKALYKLLRLQATIYLNKSTNDFIDVEQQIQQINECINGILTNIDNSVKCE